jgi:hypothetical protein
MSAKAGSLAATLLVIVVAVCPAAGADPTIPSGPVGSAPIVEGFATGQSMSTSPAVTLAAPSANAAQYGGGDRAPSTTTETQYSGGGASTSNGATGTGPATAGTMPSFGLSQWITYSRPDCCGPIGGNGPICEELYIRSGVSIPAGDGVLHKLLDTGWNISGGGRSLFFNPACDAAWTVDLGITSIYNHSQNQPKVTLITDFNNPGTPTAQLVTMRDMQRTFANASLGREWYLMGAANCCDGWTWRAGFDVGGRLGTAKIDFAEPRHRTDTIYGYFGSIHTDLEKPCGCCTGLIGFRAEWDETIMDFLDPFNNSHVQDFNLLVTFGVRF